MLPHKGPYQEVNWQQIHFGIFLVPPSKPMGFSLLWKSIPDENDNSYMEARLTMTCSQ